jgi:hypothetical protein
VGDLERRLAELEERVVAGLVKARVMEELDAMLELLERHLDHATFVKVLETLSRYKTDLDRRYPDG